MGAPDLEKDVLRVILYYDLFDYPLTMEEVARFLPSQGSTQEVQRTLRERFLRSRVETADGYVFLRGKARITQRREQLERYSQHLWRVACIVAQFLKRFPFVRAVFVTGSLSKNAADPSNDIDLMVVTQRGRLWLARTLLMLFKKIFLFNRRKYFCLNYFISEDHLEVDDKNLFTATEIAHIKPLYNEGLYWKFVYANGWVRGFFPNYELKARRIRATNGRSVLQKLLEWPLDNGMGARLDHWLMQRTADLWARRYTDFTDEERELMFRCRTYSSKVHPGNYQTKILTRYQAKLREYGLG